jgi:hypothetical protein
MRNPRTKEKEWEKKYYNVHECTRIPRTTHPNHTSRAIRARGAKCRGLFFQSTTDQIQHPSDPPEAQSPTTLVIHGRPNMGKMAQKPSTEPKVQKKRTRPSPPGHQIQSTAQGDSEII